jgi:hypothetical protein
MINVCGPEQRTYTMAVPCHHEGCNPSKQKYYCMNIARILHLYMEENELRHGNPSSNKCISIFCYKSIILKFDQLYRKK